MIKNKYKRKEKILKTNNILKVYYKAVREFNSIEWESAPSGEFAEYNVNKLAAEGAVAAIEEVLYSIGMQRYIKE